MRNCLHTQTANAPMDVNEFFKIGIVGAWPTMRTADIRVSAMESNMDHNAFALFCMQTMLQCTMQTIQKGQTFFLIRCKNTVSKRQRTVLIEKNTFAQIMKHALFLSAELHQFFHKNEKSPTPKIVK